MSKLERLELAAIVVLASAIWFGAQRFSSHISAANLVLLFSGLLLLQSLIRDLSILFIRRNIAHTPSRTVRCMCVESTVGVTGVLLGVSLIGLGVSATIAMDQIRWTLVFFITTGIGFLVKDLIFQWCPWKVRREKDHLNIVFSWKTPDT